MFTARVSSRKPACVTVNVYRPGVRKKKRYTPCRLVFADCVTPLALSFNSTAASGTTALL